MSNYIQFGSGLLYTNPNAGNLATNPTPQKGLTIQDITVDASGEIKELRGQSQYPDDTAKGDVKGTFKFSVGRKDLSMFNQIFYADTVATGGTSVVPNETHAVPASTPFTITIAPPGSGTFSTDLGVSYAASAVEFVRVASGPTVGQYSVAAGVYTFAAADEGVAVLISYAYAQTSAGATYQVNNQTMGYGPQLELWIVETYKPVAGLYSVIHLYATKVSKLAMANKRDNYAMPEVDGSYFAAASGRVIDYFSNVG